MLDKLFNMIDGENQVEILNKIINSVETILAHTADYFLKEGSTRNDALDCIIEFLEKNKKIPKN